MKLKKKRLCMKKLFIFLFITVLFAGTVSAQVRTDRGWNSNLVTLEGTLKLQRGSIAVENGEVMYLVPMLTRYIGFIEGMKEGAKVFVEGYAFGNILQPSKVTIEGKSYDFVSDLRNDFPDLERNNFGHYPYMPGRSWPNRGFGRGGCCFWS
jgi:hypothetical protein